MRQYSPWTSRYMQRWVNRSADDAQLTADPVSLKPETSTENPTLEFFGGPLSILFGVFRVVQSVLPGKTRRTPNQGWTRNGDRDSSDTGKISKMQRGYPVAEVTPV
jgi:hypothetical protein